MARTGARGGRSGGRGGRGGGRTGPHKDKPATRSRTRPIAPDPEVTDHEEVETSHHADERVVLEPTVREAIADEVYQVIHGTMPKIMAEALNALTEEMQGEKKDKENTSKKTIGKDKKKEIETIDSDDEDDMGFVRNSGKGCDYGAFKKCNPPAFDGTKDAAAAHQWIREMDAVIKISDCKDDQKVKYAAHSFTSDALYWWDNIIQAMGERAIQRMQWDELKRLVIEQFCPPYELDRMEKDFLTLEARNMTHREFTTKFNKMACLVPDLVTPESKRIKRYIQALPEDIRRLVLTAKPTTFRSVVELSGMLYEERDNVRSSEPKKKWNNGGSYNTNGNYNNNGKRIRNDNHRSGEKKVKVEEQSSKAGYFEEKKECRKCGKKHHGECRLGSNLCYRCGQTGHFSYECPRAKCVNCGETGHLAAKCIKGERGRSGNDKSSKMNTGDKPKAKARAFNISQKEAKEQPDVVSD